MIESSFNFLHEKAVCQMTYLSTHDLNSSDGRAVKTVAYAGFFNGGGSVTSHRHDVKILQLQ